MKLRNTLRPYYPIRDRIIKIWARRRLSHLNLQRGALDEHKIDYADLALLHRAVVDRRAKVVLEFGIGFSTLVIGDALKKTGGHLWTVDANEYWIVNTKKKLKDEPVTIIHSSVEVIGMNHRYRDLPDIVPDIIYLDGPSPRDVPNWDGPPISSDVLHYEPNLKVGCLLVIDGRFTNLEYLKSRCRRNWFWRRDDRLRRTEAVLIE